MDEVEDNNEAVDNMYDAKGKRVMVRLRKG